MEVDAFAAGSGSSVLTSIGFDCSSVDVTGVSAAGALDEASCSLMMYSSKVKTR